MSPGWEGLLLIDKPRGPTSHAIVQRVRRATGQRRIGHGGTLDPLATGLLPLVVGRATRLVRFLPRSPKTYIGTFELGLQSTTDDIAGEILERHAGALPGPAEVAEQASHLVGAGLQVPPSVSARKVGGQRLYKLARRGVSVEAPATPVEIDRFDVRPAESAAHYDFIAVVSGGTYIRSMVRDLGRELGCGGVLTALRRTRIGPMEIERAVALADERSDAEALRAGLIPIDRIPLDPPAVQLGEPDEVRLFSRGGLLGVEPGRVPDGFCRVLAPGGRLLGVADMRAGTLQPRVVLEGAAAPEAGR